MLSYYKCVHRETIMKVHKWTVNISQKVCIPSEAKMLMFGLTLCLCDDQHLSLQVAYNEKDGWFVNEQFYPKRNNDCPTLSTTHQFMGSPLSVI